MILFFGPAGAGKSVQGQLLAETMGWKWLSSGQLLRESTDQEIIDLLKGGNLIPLEKFGEMFAAAIKSAGDVDHVILDGFPRKLEQAEWLIARRDDLGREIRLAVVLDLPEEEIIKRMMLRGREDDNPEAIAKRLAIYHTEIDPILNYLENQAVPVVHVDGVGAIEEVNERVVQEIKAHSIA